MYCAGIDLISISVWFQGERATGYGVALLSTFFGRHSSNPLLQASGPELPSDTIPSATEEDATVVWTTWDVCTAAVLMTYCLA